MEILDQRLDAGRGGGGVEGHRQRRAGSAGGGTDQRAAEGDAARGEADLAGANPLVADRDDVLGEQAGKHQRAAGEIVLGVVEGDVAVDDLRPGVDLGLGEGDGGAEAGERRSVVERGEHGIVAVPADIADPPGAGRAGEGRALGKAGEGSADRIAAVIVDDGVGGAVGRAVAADQAQIERRAAEGHRAVRLELVVAAGAGIEAAELGGKGRARGEADVAGIEDAGAGAGGQRPAARHRDDADDCRCRRPRRHSPPIRATR